MKDSCSGISMLLEKYFDQEVTNEERSLVEAHLVDCHVCQDMLRSMEGLKNIIKAPIEEAAQKEDFQWIWQKIERGIRIQERTPFWETIRSWLEIHSLFQKKRWVPAAAIVTILLITVPLLIKKNPSYLNQSVIEYVESQTHNVMVYESENAKVTVIWLLEGSAKEIPPS